MSGVDDYGNEFPQGISVGPSSAPQVQLLPGSAPGSAAQVNFPTPFLDLSNDANVAAAENGTSANLQISGPALAESGANDWMQLALFSNDGSGSGAANMEFIYVDTSGTPLLCGSVTNDGWSIDTALSVLGEISADSDLIVSGITETAGLVVGGQELTIPQPAPAATAAAIISALQAAGIFS
jgi:hypothetical protein